MSEKYDVIIIGAGIGGLTAGAILAKNGKKVLILEKNPVAGGYAVNFRRGEFEFDASLHMICGCEEGGAAYNILKKCGVLERVKFLKPKYLYRAIFPDFDFRVVQGSPQQYIKDLIKKFPAEYIGIQKLFNEISRIHSEMLALFYSKIPFCIERIYFPLKYPKLFWYRNKTFQEMLNKLVKDNRLKAIISQLWPFVGLPPSKSSVFYFSYVLYDYLCKGGYYPKGGSQSFSNAFAEVIKENNGELLLNKEVASIIIEDGIAKGIKTKDNEEFYGRIIVSNIDANTTFLRLVGGKYMSKTFKDILLKAEPSISIFQIYLGLNIDLKAQGIQDYEIFFNSNYDIDLQYGSLIRNSDIDNIFYAITLYSNLDYNIAPSGKSVIGITTLTGYDFWKRLSKEDYGIVKKKVADFLIKRAEKIIPGLSSLIEKITIATPLTMERYSGNLKGAVYGWGQIISQSGIKRMGVKTPIKNIYLASAWTQPGGGIGGVIFAGERVAEEILRRC